MNSNQATAPVSSINWAEYPLKLWEKIIVAILIIAGLIVGGTDVLEGIGIAIAYPVWRSVIVMAWDKQKKRKQAQTAT